MRLLTILLSIALFTGCATAKPKEKHKRNMPGAPSLDSVQCTDVPRWHTRDFGSLDTLSLDTPVSLGFSCVTDFCMELFIPADNFSKPVEGTDYTLDGEAGTITFLSTSDIAWGQQGGGQESWTLIAYFNDLECEEEDECKAITCCDEPLHAHSSADATSSGQCSSTCLEPLITSSPVSGAQINVPSYLVLSSDVPDATIYYTLDGTEPDEDSEEYTAPILIESIGTIIRAIGVMDGCTPGPIANIQFSNPSFPFAFCYACDTPDNGGQWDDFTPNGSNDNHWKLQFTLSDTTAIQRLELYQLDSTGAWTTGQVWSTNSPINPWPETPDTDFECFPLLVFDTAVQQWVDYEETLGSFGAASYIWDLYGDIVLEVDAEHLFRLDIILEDGTKLSQTIEAVCSASCVVCTAPDTPTLTSQCVGSIDVTFTGPVGRDFAIYMRSNVTGCGDGSWEQVDSGNIAASPTTRPIVDLTQGCLYEFYVSIDISGCGYRDSATASAAPLYHATVEIASDKLSVIPNETFTISWDSEHIGGAVCGSCLDGEVTINQSIGCKAGNAAGSSVQSQSTCGVYTYQITGCNSCNTVIASVQVNVECACSTCVPATAPARIRFVSPTTFLQGFMDPDTPFTCNPGAYYPGPAWNGELFKVAGTCSYGDLVTARFGGDRTDLFGSTWYAALFIKCEHVPAQSKWILTILGDTNSGGPTYWVGERSAGCSPIGSYTKTGGCCSGPASITTIA